MAVSENNKVFYKVYNKTRDLLEQKVLKYSNYRKYGGKIPFNEIKILLLYITYLESIDKSQYNYFYIEGLTNISNHLNKL